MVNGVNPLLSGATRLIPGFPSRYLITFKCPVKAAAVNAVMPFKLEPARLISGFVARYSIILTCPLDAAAVNGVLPNKYYSINYYKIDILSKFDAQD